LYFLLFSIWINLVIIIHLFSFLLNGEICFSLSIYICIYIYSVSVIIFFPSTWYSMSRFLWCHYTWSSDTHKKSLVYSRECVSINRIRHSLIDREVLHEISHEIWQNDWIEIDVMGSRNEINRIETNENTSIWVIDQNI